MTDAIVTLNSDFRDFYDHHFAGSWQAAAHTFSRRTGDGPDRLQMLGRMQAAGLAVPRFGVVRELCPAILASTSLPAELARSVLAVVIHADALTHAGAGKSLVSLEDAARDHPDALAVEHIPALPSGLGQTLRYLRIGRRQFWLRYTSLDDWRSNCGDVQIDFLCEEKPKTYEELAASDFQCPLLAVDFVRGDKLYAIDLNVSPQIGGTGVENKMKPREAFQEIADWIQRFGDWHGELLDRSHTHKHTF